MKSLKEFCRGLNPDTYPMSRTIPQYFSKNPLMRRLFYKRLEVAVRLVEFKEDDVVLDVGCGPGLLLQLMSSFVGCAVGVDVRDLSPVHRWLEAAKNSNCALVRADGNFLPFGSGVASAVFCLDTLEHIPTASRVVGEISRVVKKDGVVVFSLPTENTLFKFLSLVLRPRKYVEEGRHYWNAESLLDMISSHLSVEKVECLPMKRLPLFILLRCRVKTLGGES
jgi:ubiquinone/menaquinone biosynthesis C-methylase UbiE